MKFAVLLSLLLMTSCTATKLTSSWTAPKAGNNDYKKILVVSIIQHKDTSIHRKMESHLSRDLQALGYSAVGFRETFRDGELKNIRYDSVRKILSEKGIDGVITISLMATEKESVYVRDKGGNDTDGLPLRNFWQSPTQTVKQDIGKPGYYLTATSYYWQSHFYDVATVDLLYSSQSTAFEVLSTEHLAHKYGKMIVKDLQKNYVLSTKH
jgi:hypothetical protein